MIDLPWEKFKDYILRTNSLMFWLIDKDGYYAIISQAGEVPIVCNMPMTKPPSADQLDFETNFKK